MSIFDYGNKKREIGHSDFNESFQNLYSADFGELRPVACYEVLADDKWRIAQNSITKVAPMPAPAFTRLKQNFYSFFVPNQIIWKHWNDFFTNGTAYLDTYGNNQTNQDITNQWRVPSIPANDLQLIAKIGNGWAAPVFRLSSDYLTVFNRMLFLNSDQGSYIEFNLPEEQFVDSDPANATFSHEALWSLAIASGKWRLPAFFKKIPYVHPQINYTIGSADGNNNRTLSIGLLTGFAFACDLHTAKEFFNWLDTSLTDNVVNNNVMDESADSTMVESSADGVTTNFTEQVNTVYNMSIRCWSNIIDDYTSMTSAPFILDKYSYNCHTNTYDTAVLNTYMLKRNYHDVKHYEYTSKFYHNGSDSSDFYWIDHFVDNTRFYNRHFGIVYSNDRSSVQGYLVNGIIFWSNDDYSLEYVDYIMDYDDSYLTFFSGIKFLVDNHSAFSISSVLLPYVLQLGDFRSYNPDFINFYFFSPFQLLNPLSLDDPSFIQSNYLGSRGLSCDVYLHVYQNIFGRSGSGIFYDLPTFDVVTPSEFSLGYDSWGFMVNSCMKCIKNLDSLNIPPEGLCSRSWEDYAGELVNALPVFAESKIINSYFRNKTTSSAELDYKYANGTIYMSYGRLQYLRILRSLNVPLSDQVKDILDNNLQCSWVIPCSTAPKNGLSSYTTEFTSSDIFLSYVSNEYHYYNVQSFFDVLSLLTGWNLTANFVHKILNFCTKKTISSKQYLLLSGLLLDNVYLPNYYNGLLRLRYQNFSKDYFSSCVLDPLHGANDVSVGDTISELRANVAQQGFWETSAFARSIKRFFQNMVGTTPTHADETDPILLGVDHLPINIGEVIQTSQTTETSPQGQRSGLGAAAGKGGLCKHYFNEQGWILVFSSITLEQQYYQGLERQFTPYRNFLDYPFIDFVGLGNQSVPMRELKWQTAGRYVPAFPDNLLPIQNVYTSEGSKLLYDGRTTPLFIKDVAGTTGSKQVNVVANTTTSVGYDVADPQRGYDEIFGYIPRFSTYKFKLDQVHGAFRDQMDYWQTFRRFYKNPMLVHEFVNWEFVQDDGELRRLFAVEDSDVSDKFYVDCYINAKVTRALPVVCRPSKHI